LLSFDVMQRQSFSGWQLPRDLSGVVLLEDLRAGLPRYTSSERHFHDELELHFIERGRALFLLSGGKLTARAGTLLFIPPRQGHVVLEASDDCRRWMLLCRPRLVRRVLPKGAHEALLGRTAKEWHGVLRGRSALALRQTFREIHGDRRQALSLFNAAVAFGLSRAWLELQAADASPEPSALHPAVARAIDLIREGARPSMAELAERCEMSESHLSKLFSAQVGTSITEFRNRQAIERFLDVYGDGTRRNLLDAALESGFGSYPQFHRVFKKFLGYPPGELRRRAIDARA